MLMLFGILILVVDMAMRKLCPFPISCLTNFTKTVTFLEDEKAKEDAQVSVDGNSRVSEAGSPAECDSRLGGDNERHSSLLASPYQILYIFGPGTIWLFKSYVKSIISL